MGHCSCGGCSCTAAQKKTEHRHSFLRRYWRAMLSFALLLAGMAMSATRLSCFAAEPVLLLWYAVAYLPVGLPVLREAWESIRERDCFNEFTLMVVATIGAFYIGEYPEGVAVMLFYTVGELFQEQAVDRARRNIGALLDVRPERATVVRRGGTVEVSPREVYPGETIEVHPGERVPLDGVLKSEAASFNTAALTGESLPRDIRAGEEVLAGMIATDRVVRISVTRPFDQSALARILELVQHASERKAPAELFIRRFARIYTPAVAGLALLIVLLPYLYSLVQSSFFYHFDDWFYRALVFLVVSCPCALVVSIPLGYFGGIGAASRLGILFKGGNYLDAITRVDTVVFDKTGTLTEGVFAVHACRCAPGMTEQQLLQTIASVERESIHPVAKAVVTYAEQRQIVTLPVEETKELAGYGLEAVLQGMPVLVGNLRLLSRFGIAFPAELHAETDTLVACAVGGSYVGCLLLADSLKPDAHTAIERLRAAGVAHIRILSGDKQGIVSDFARRLGVTEAYGDLLPDDKVRHIEALQQESRGCVAFVGDGMNDAPVLALSHVGIAMGRLGSDVAIEAADVVVQTDQPSRVADAICVGRLTRRIVWQNIALAFGVKLLVLALGAGGVATLWEAVFADVGVALLAILNAVRIQHTIK